MQLPCARQAGGGVDGDGGGDGGSVGGLAHGAVSNISILGAEHTPVASSHENTVSSNVEPHGSARLLKAQPVGEVRVAG
mgnify:CR=1 FL=1